MRVCEYRSSPRSPQLKNRAIFTRHRIEHRSPRQRGKVHSPMSGFVVGSRMEDVTTLHNLLLSIRTARVARQRQGGGHSIPMPGICKRSIFSVEIAAGERKCNMRFTRLRPCSTLDAPSQSEHPQSPRGRHVPAHLAEERVQLVVYLDNGTGIFVASSLGKI